VAAYNVRIKASAARELEETGSKADRLRIVKRIRTLATTPRPSGSEKLAGESNAWRVRQGDYRILYTVDDNAHVVLIFRIGHRREVYRSA
jgi:mRNA interferase RelE/StbE